jgi:hypothetical protein
MYYSGRRHARIRGSAEEQITVLSPGHHHDQYQGPRNLSSNDVEDVWMPGTCQVKGVDWSIGGDGGEGRGRLSGEVLQDTLMVEWKVPHKVGNVSQRHLKEGRSNVPPPYWLYLQCSLLWVSPKAMHPMEGGSTRI